MRRGGRRFLRLYNALGHYSFAVVSGVNLLQFFSGVNLDVFYMRSAAVQRPPPLRLVLIPSIPEMLFPLIATKYPRPDIAIIGSGRKMRAIGL